MTQTMAEDLLVCVADPIALFLSFPDLIALGETTEHWHKALEPSFARALVHEWRSQDGDAACGVAEVLKSIAQSQCATDWLINN